MPIRKNLIDQMEGKELVDKIAALDLRLDFGSYACKLWKKANFNQKWDKFSDLFY